MELCLHRSLYDLFISPSSISPNQPFDSKAPVNTINQELGCLIILHHQLIYIIPRHKRRFLKRRKKGAIESGHFFACELIQYQQVLCVGNQNSHKTDGIPLPLIQVFKLTNCAAGIIKVHRVSETAARPDNSITPMSMCNNGTHGDAENADEMQIIRQ